MDKLIKKIIGDGNCLFRCLAYQHYRCQQFHKKVRTEIVLYVAQNWVDFEPFIVGDSSFNVNISFHQECASHMGALSVFGGKVEVWAFAKIYEYWTSN